jgi:hypothetical protein
MLHLQNHKKHMLTVVFDRVMMAFLATVLVATAAGAAYRYPLNQRRKQQHPAVTAVILTPAEAAAKAQFDLMANSLNSAEGIQYDATVTYPWKKKMRTVHASVLLERTAKMLVRTTDEQDNPQETIYADGSMFTLYDLKSNKYVQIVTSSDLFSVQQALNLGWTEIFPKETRGSSGLKHSLSFPYVFFSRNYDRRTVSSGETLTYSMSNIRAIDGTPVDLVTQTLSSPRIGSISASTMIDPTTNLPIHFTQIETRPGHQPETNLDETFSNFTVLHKPLPGSPYAFIPPFGSTAFKVQ